MERDLYMLDSDSFVSDSGAAPYIPGPLPELGTHCPLLPSAVTFDAIANALGISAGTAGVLDDVRFLTASILQSSGDALGTTRIRNTASWLHDRLAVLQLAGSVDEEGRVQAAVCRAASVYSWAIQSGRRLSAFDDETVRGGLLGAVQSVRPARWKRMPGIYLWVVLVACSGAPGDMIGRFWRRKVAVATSAIAFENFPLAISCVRSFLRVQSWLARGGLAAEEKEAA